MKSKKKLLIAMAAMSVAAIGAGTVSTFAWYQANSLGGKAKTALSDAMTVSTADPQYEASSVDLPINVKVTRVTLISGRTVSARSLELVHYFGENEMATAGAGSTALKKKTSVGGTWTTNAAGFYRAYYETADASSLVYEAAPLASALDTTNGGAGLDPYALYDIGVYVEFPANTAVDRYTGGTSGTAPTTGEFFCDDENAHTGTVKWRDSNGNDWEEDDVKDVLKTTNVKYSIANNGGTDRAYIFDADNDNTSPALGTGTVISTGISATADTTHSLSGIDSATEGSPVFIGNFGLYVEGDNGGTKDAKNSTLTVNFKVTVEKAA